MLISKKNFLAILFTLLFITVISFSSQLDVADNKLDSYINKGIEVDQFGRIVKDAQNKKISYQKNDEYSLGEPIFGAPKDIFISKENKRQFQLSSRLDSLSLVEDWRTGIFGSGIGQSGIVTADIDNDGVIEVICGGATSTFGSDNFWYILEYSSESSEYEMNWISDLYSVGISNIVAFDIEGNDIYNIFIGLSNGDIQIYNASTMEEDTCIYSPAGAVNRILFTDTDNDAINEITFCDEDNVFIYNATTFSLESQIPYGANDFEVGNVDTDPANEIVLSSGMVLEFNGDTTIVEWQYPGGDFGYLIELSDIDSDNMEEIIGASSWYYITSFDADIQSPKGQIPTDLDIDALLLSDIDGDGIEEVLYGDGQWGEIHCYDAVTLNQKWEIGNPEHGVTDIAVFDTDLDGDLEVLWGAGATSTGEDHLYIHGIPTLSLEWESIHLDGPFHAIDVGDVDDDDQNEIVFASFESNSGYSDGVVSIFDAATHTLEWQSPVNMFGENAWTGIHDLKIGDVDDDETNEIIVATDRVYDGAIYVINGLTHTIEQSNFYDDGAPIYSLSIADIDNDGEMEIIAGGGREHTGAPGVYVYFIDGATGVVEWTSVSLGSYWSEVYTLEVGDIDNDSVQEVVAINNSIFVFDGISHQQWQSSQGGYYGLDLCDIDSDNVKEIIVGTEGGNIIAIDGESHEEKFNFNVSSSSIDGLRAYDIDKNGNIELIFGSSGILGVYGIQDEIMLWQSDQLSANAGRYNSLVVSDFDLDGCSEVLIGTNFTVCEFEGPQYSSIDEDNESKRNEFILYQNNPQPFSLSTTISYVLPEASHVKLSICNVVGQIIETLVDDFQPAGPHSVTWNAKAAKSGIYFYLIETDNHKDSRKCCLVK